MGCDIHLAVEVQSEDGTWHRAEKKQKNPYYEKWPEDEAEFEWDEWYGNRNYALFGVLAGVRTQDGSETIMPPRGWPDDVSPETKEKSDRYGWDGHSHSWFTLRELLEYDWDRPVKHSALTKAAEPGETQAQLQQRVQDWIDRHGSEPDWLFPTCQAAYPETGWTRIEWSVPAQGHIGPGWGDFLKRLVDAAPDRDPDKIRIVFFFDN